MNRSVLWMLRVALVLPLVTVEPVVHAKTLAGTPLAAAKKLALVRTGSIAIEVTEASANGVSRTVRLAIATADRGEPAQLHTRIGTASYKLQIRLGNAPAGAVAPFLFEIERRDGTGSADVWLSATRVLVAGQSALIGSIQRADGSRTEVVAQLL